MKFGIRVRFRCLLRVMEKSESCQRAEEQLAPPRLSDRMRLATHVTFSRRDTARFRLAFPQGLCLLSLKKADQVAGFPQQERFCKNEPLRYLRPSQASQREDTKLTSYGMILAIIGGALITPAQGALLDACGVSLSYLLPLICFVIIFLFAVTANSSGSQKVGLRAEA